MICINKEDIKNINPSKLTKNISLIDTEPVLGKESNLCMLVDSYISEDPTSAIELDDQGIKLVDIFLAESTC